MRWAARLTKGSCLVALGDPQPHPISSCQLVTHQVNPSTQRILSLFLSLFSCLSSCLSLPFFLFLSFSSSLPFSLISTPSAHKPEAFFSALALQFITAFHSTVNSRKTAMRGSLPGHPRTEAQPTSLFPIPLTLGPPHSHLQNRVIITPILPLRAVFRLSLTDGNRVKQPRRLGVVVCVQLSYGSLSTQALCVLLPDFP